ncbi:DEAD/DEAH box helicase [bacterium]|nr:DEAD/DEAH box helicase [bacterium]
MQAFYDFVRSIERHPRFSSQVAAYQYVSPKEAQYASIPLDERVKKVLTNRGITQFWTHQKEGIESLRQGKNVVIMTPTSSGKTLIYNIPVMETVLEDSQAKALYVFPLKGLEQDQVKELNGLFTDLGLQPSPNKGERNPLQAAEVYDGDVSPYRRRKIRQRFPRVVFTNPDMIHLALNSFHDKWKEFFSHLKYVVVDEIHSYHGIFGSNAAHIFRRLRRICRFYGSDPQFIACSATIANPKELAQNLTGLTFKEILESGAPQGGKHFCFINPQYRSPYTQATWLFVECLKAGFKTILFTKARKITELIYTWTTERAGEYAEKISPYRAGFLPQERREIEKKLFQDQLMGVVSTSALELGVDIGGLDACILVGYPGSVASTWQRSGRVGRRGKDSLVFMVAIRDALDQYYMRHPQSFFGESHEAVVVDPQNKKILKRHLPCAASEIYLREKDSVYDVSALKPHLQELVEEGKLNQGRKGDIWFSRRRRPQREVSIRGIGETFSILLEEGEKIGEVDHSRVYMEAFPGAVYLHRGKQYQVRELDIDKRKAVCREVDVNYYTQVLSRKQTAVLSRDKRKRTGKFEVNWGRLRMTHQVVGFDKRRLWDGRRLSRHRLEMPENVFDTEGLWMVIDPTVQRALEFQGFDLGGSLHAVEHASIKCIPLYAVCERNDIGGLSHPFYPPIQKAAVFIYDGYEGGIAFTWRAFQVLREWIESTVQIIKECPCQEGCPSCVQDPQCGSANEPLDKEGALFLLEESLKM